MNGSTEENVSAQPSSYSIQLVILLLANYITVIELQFLIEQLVSKWYGGCSDPDGVIHIVIVGEDDHEDNDDFIMITHAPCDNQIIRQVFNQATLHTLG